MIYFKHTSSQEKKNLSINLNLNVYSFSDTALGIMKRICCYIMGCTRHEWKKVSMIHTFQSQSSIDDISSSCEI